jgi:D-serine deaminase-like pyridoxal phosphate-dependent protein
MSEIGRPKDQLDTPALWVDLDKMEANIETLAAHFNEAGVQWRPHTKGIKVPAIAHRALRAGAIGITCAKLGEAEVMAAAGIGDILVANQVVGPRKIERLVRLSRHADVKVAVDNPANIEEIGMAATSGNTTVSVLVELNTGMDRAGVSPGQPALELSRLAHATPGIHYRGLMAWEGHAVRIQDVEEKRRIIEKAVGQLQETVALCRDAGLPVEIVSGGGSGTYKITPFLDEITEIQAGGAIFSDVANRNRHVETDPALFLRATITSRPAPDRIIYDAGFKALPTWFGDPQPLGLDHIEEIRTSAEHGKIVLSTPNDAPEVGYGLDFVIGYGDVTVFMHDVLYGVRNDIVETEWVIAGRGKLQ